MKFHRGCAEDFLVKPTIDNIVSSLSTQGGDILFIYDDEDYLLKVADLNAPIYIEKLVLQPKADLFYEQWSRLILEEHNLAGGKNEDIRHHDADQEAQTTDHKVAHP